MKYCKLVADNRNLLLTVIDQVQNQFGDRFALKGPSVSWFTGGTCCLCSYTVEHRNCLYWSFIGAQSSFVSSPPVMPKHVLKTPTSNSASSEVNISTWWWEMHQGLNTQTAAGCHTGDLTTSVRSGQIISYLKGRCRSKENDCMGENRILTVIFHKESKGCWWCPRAENHKVQWGKTGRTYRNPWAQSEKFWDVVG